MNQQQITLIGIGVTFIIGVLNFIYSIRNNSKTRFINTITSSRIKWIGDLRENISDYISIVPLNGTNYIELFENKKEFIESFNKSNMRIALMLNKRDDFDNELSGSLYNISIDVMEIMKCINLFKFNYLKEFENLNIQGKHNIKIKFINELNKDTQEFLKNEIISILGRNDNEYKNIEANEFIIKTEYEGWGIKDDAYFTCICDISKRINIKVNNLVNKSKELLKKEWDRAKIESEIGKYDMDNHNWNINVGISKLTKLFRLIFVIMFLVIIILTILV